MNAPGVKYGFLGGIVVLFYFVLLYFANTANFLNPWLQWASMVVYVVCMYKAFAEDIETNGYNRDFRELTRTPFTTFLIINLVYWIFYYGVHLADPSLVVAELTYERSMHEASFQAGPGDPQLANQLRDRITELNKLIQNPKPQPIGPVITRMLMGAIGGFAIAAVMVALKRLNRE